MDFIKEIKDRKVRKYLGIYISASITAIGLTHLFSLRYDLPTYIFDALLVFIISGIAIVTIIAWYHGKEGKQKIKWWEYLLHLFIITCALTIIYLQINKNPLTILPLNSKTIAVLPFSNMSESKEDEFFSNGITEDILTQLSKISKLRVISRTTVMNYQDSDLSIPEIGKKLSAGSILEGSIRRYGNKIRISAQLINASNDQHIWAETFDKQLDDIFEVQSEIAKQIANELEAKLAPKEVVLIDSRPTNNIEAYAFYLKGREAASRYEDSENEKAINYYKKALLIDSSYALAYAGLASSYDQKVRRYFYGEEWRDSAIEMSKKALVLNSNLAEGHSSLAKSYEASGEYKLAKYHYEEAIRLNPNYYAAIYNLGVVYFNEEKLDKAYNLIKHSIQLEPDNVFGYIVLAAIYQKFNCNIAAVDWLKRALELEPTNLLGHLYLSDQYCLLQDFTNAQIILDRLFEIAPKWPFGLSQQAKIYLLNGQYKNAIRSYKDYYKSSSNEEEYDYAFLLMQINNQKKANTILEKEREKYLTEIENRPEQSFLNENYLANVYVLLGDKNKALLHLKKSVENGFIDYQRNLIYPYMDSLKNELRFIELISAMKTKVDSMMVLAKEADENWTDCRSLNL